MKNLILIGLLSFLSGTGDFIEKNNTKTPPFDYMEVPSFVNQQANFIHYKEQLTPFFEKLKRIKNGSKEKVHILHIGDSHLQAGGLSAEFRQLMQMTFGNAGRGLIFPYHLVRTNSPADFSTSSNVEWRSSRNVSVVHEIPVGISGYSVSTSNANFKIDLNVRNKTDLFNQITILGKNPNDAYAIEFLNADASKLKADKINSSIGECFKLDEMRTSLSIAASRSSETNVNYTVQGILLENTEKGGVLYSATAVNGATYSSFNKSEDFFKQANALEPDLVILSLGTNDIASLNMNPDWVLGQIKYLMEQLKKQQKPYCVLMVTSPDFYIRNQAFAKNSIMLGDMMHDMAKHSESIAIWDFFDIMGGAGSINKWTNMKLASTDRSHYTAEGYRLQGQLLFKAMLKAYEDFEKQ
jgi:lysophospholipase L1-like esterase